MFCVTSRLRDDPFVDEKLRLLGEAEEKLSLDLHSVNRLHSFVNLVIQRLNLLLKIQSKLRWKKVFVT